MGNYLNKNHFYFAVSVLLILAIEVVEPFSLMAQGNIENLYEITLETKNQEYCLKVLGNMDAFVDLIPQDPSESEIGSGAIFHSDAYINLGVTYEELHRCPDIELALNKVLDRNPNDAFALYNLGLVKGLQGEWQQSKDLFAKTVLIKSDFVMGWSHKALAEYQLGNLDQAQSDLRLLIRRYPMFADARAALSALLSSQGSLGEAESHWVAAVGLDARYRERHWLEKIRGWPPAPVNDLMNFLDFLTT